MTVKDKVLHMAQQAGYGVHQFLRDDNSSVVTDIGGQEVLTQKAIAFYQLIVSEACQLFDELAKDPVRSVITALQAREMIETHFMTKFAEDYIDNEMYMADCYRCRVKEVEFPRRIKNVTETLTRRITDLEAAVRSHEENAGKCQALVESVIRCGQLRDETEQRNDGTFTASAL